MKKKLSFLLMLLLSVFVLTSCGQKEEEENKTNSNGEEVYVEPSTPADEINEGEIDGYKFKVTNEETDRVKIQMNSGDIMLVVLSNKDTPITIKNFKKLVKKGYYDGLTFHRVYKDFMIQGGDPKGDGTGGSGVEIKGEFASNGVKNSLSHTRGVISMARSNDPNSASSQFFIMHADNTGLDGNYASFGKVFAGLSTLDKIANIEVVPNSGGEMSKPVTAPTIKSIKFITVEKVEKAEN